ncbi:MAG: ATPase [Burkholderiales bacterium]|nr:ATPase [Burkholderiales bacterium]
MAIDYLIGVDGGGTGTRVVLADREGSELARATGGPSGLGLGITLAWVAISDAVQVAFERAGISRWQRESCAIGLGLAGVHNPQWAQGFVDAAPSFSRVKVQTDGHTTLLGAHDGRPGAIVAVGTGLVGEAWFGGEAIRTVSAWGFPNGDEGSGAWIGLQAARAAQCALDGRASVGAMTGEIIAMWGGTVESAFEWLGRAGQTTFAQLAPVVLRHGTQDPIADTILRQAGAEVALVARALDPEARLPLALCGGLADALRPWLPHDLARRAGVPLGDSARGALHLVQDYVNG